MPARHLAPTREDAETMAIRAVGFLAAKDDLLVRFAGLTGVAVDDLRSRLTDGAVLGAVLDFILADERLLIEFAEAIDVPPEAPYAARRRLPGAPVASW